MREVGEVHDLYYRSCWSYWSFMERSATSTHDGCVRLLFIFLFVHCSLFIVHCSLFIVHCSLFIVHCLSFICKLQRRVGHCCGSRLWLEDRHVGVFFITIRPLLPKGGGGAFLPPLFPSRPTSLPQICPQSPRLRGQVLMSTEYRDTSPTEKRPPPYEPPRTLGIGPR